MIEGSEALNRKEPQGRRKDYIGVAYFSYFLRVQYSFRGVPRIWCEKLSDFVSHCFLVVVVAASDAHSYQIIYLRLALFANSETEGQRICGFIKAVLQYNAHIFWERKYLTLFGEEKIHKPVIYSNFPAVAQTSNYCSTVMSHTIVFESDFPAEYILEGIIGLRSYAIQRLRKNV